MESPTSPGCKPAPPSAAGARLRAVAYYAGQALATLLFAPCCVLLYPFPHRWRYRFTRQWTRFALWWLKCVCKLDFQVQGREHAAAPAIVACKHQSAWETFALQLVFPPVVFVLKRELLRIPFFGWGLAGLDPIAIDRGSPGAALRAIVREGQERLARGLSVVIFPEGTRVAPGQRGRYGPTVGLLARKTGCPVIPVAHNAGWYWPRNGFLKRPGVIRMVVGPPIEARDRSAREIASLAEEWIESTAARLPRPD